MTNETSTDFELTGSTETFPALQAVLLDVEAACGALPVEEREQHRAAQQSVVDARRSAELHEGLLQVC